METMKKMECQKVETLPFWMWGLIVEAAVNTDTDKQFVHHSCLF